MGAPMARNLARAGQLAAVWNRTAAVAESLAQELGAVAAPSPAELASTVDAVFICVSADADVLQVVEAIVPGLKPGSVAIDHSTVSVETARAAAALVRGRGADFLDAPVSGGVEGAKAGALAIMVGGKEETLERVRPQLQAMARRIAYMGETGAGQATKAVNQIMCAGINQAVTEALAFGTAQGLDMERVIDIVASGAAGNWFLEKRGVSMTRGSYPPGFKIALHRKDLQICLEMAETLGMPLPITGMTLGEYDILIRQGHGDEDISALYRLKMPASDN